MIKYDALVIGYGPAGISAAIYLKRYGHNVLVIGKDNGALEKAHEIENYYNIRSKKGIDFVNDGIKQAISLGIHVNKDEVLAIEYGLDGFIIKTKKQEYEAKTIFIATGKARNSFVLAKKYEGVGVSYCATCDGFFYKNKEIALVGYNDYMKHELEYLLPLASKVTVYTNGNELEVDLPSNVSVIKEKITELYGNERFEGIKTDTTDNKFSGCFVALGSANAFTMAKHLGLVIDDKNNLVVDDKKMTNIPGIFAGGDVIGGIYQIVKAAADGAIAADSMNKYLRGL